MKPHNHSLVAILAGLVALALCGVPTVATAGPEDYSPSLVELLQAIDLLPPTAELIEFGAGDEGEVLKDIALDVEMGPYTRQRAIGFLTRFPTDDNARALETLVRDPAQQESIRLAALFALSLDQRPERPTQLESTLLDLLTGANEEMTAAAIRASEHLDSERALRVLAAIPEARLLDSEYLQAVFARAHDAASAALSAAE